jgi:hypothetical protein
MAGPTEPQARSHEIDPEVESVLRDPDSMKWMGRHLDDLRTSVATRRIRNQLVWIGVIAGLAAHVVGYLIRASGPAEPLGIVADLLAAAGLAVWTGTVVVVLTEIIPEAKERQIQAAIDAYEAAVTRDAQTPQR